MRRSTRKENLELVEYFAQQVSGIAVKDGDAILVYITEMLVLQCKELIAGEAAHAQNSDGSLRQELQPADRRVEAA